MKKIISVINAAALALALCSCGRTDGDTENDIGGFSSAASDLFNGREYFEPVKMIERSL